MLPNLGLAKGLIINILTKYYTFYITIRRKGSLSKGAILPILSSFTVSCIRFLVHFLILKQSYEANITLKEFIWLKGYSLAYLENAFPFIHLFCRFSFISWSISVCFAESYDIKGWWLIFSTFSSSFQRDRPLQRFFKQRTMSNRAKTIVCNTFYVWKKILFVDWIMIW